MSGRVRALSLLPRGRNDPPQLAELLLGDAAIEQDMIDKGGRTAAEEHVC